MKKFMDSCVELKSVRNLVISAMLVAVSVVLGFFSFLLTESIRISFTFLPNEIGAMFFGPVAGGIIAGVSDILRYIIKPMGDLNLGITLSAITGGLIYGFILYKRPLRLRRVIAANVTVALVSNLLMNTLWLSIARGVPYFALFPARLVQQLVLVPINIVLFYSVSRLLLKAGIMHNNTEYEA